MCSLLFCVICYVFAFCYFCMLLDNCDVKRMGLVSEIKGTPFHGDKILYHDASPRRTTYIRLDARYVQIGYTKSDIVCLFFTLRILLCAWAKLGWIEGPLSEGNASKATFSMMFLQRRTTCIRSDIRCV